MTTVDAHQHFWDPTKAVYPWMEADELAPIRRPFSPLDLRPLLNEEGLDVSIFVQCRHDENETAEQLALTLIHPWIAGIVGWVDLEAPNISERIARLQSLPGGSRLVGVRHIVHDEPDPNWLAQPSVISGLRAIAEAGLAFDLLVRARELPAAIKAVRAVPYGRFVLDHMAKPPFKRGWDPFWAARFKELAEEPNVSCKISGLVTEAVWNSWTVEDFMPACELAIESFGSKRLIYGSDWPVCLLAASYGQVKALFDKAVVKFSEIDRAAVLGGNAINTYRLDQHKRMIQSMEVTR